VVPPSKENICAVVVTHFTDAGIGQRLERTKSQVSHVVVVDNASQSTSLERIQAAACTPGIELIQNPINVGVAAALNRGIEWARTKGYQWVLLLDDDTLPAPDMVATLIRAFEQFPARNQVAMIGANVAPEPASGGKQSQNGWWRIVETIITSGTLLSLAAAEVIGPLREQFFLDCIDFEYCLRARRMGFQVLEVVPHIMQHMLGNPKTVRLFGLTISTYNHKPFRSYYRIRNFITLIREYAFWDPWWIIRMSYAITKIVVLILLLEESRASKFGYMLLGFYDGLLGRFTRRVV